MSVEKGSLEFTMYNILYYVCTVTHTCSPLSPPIYTHSTQKMYGTSITEKFSPPPHIHTPTHPHTHTHTSDENPESTGRLLGFRGNVAKWLATLPLQEERETK